jgi:hypothetical protein
MTSTDVWTVSGLQISAPVADGTLAGWASLVSRMLSVHTLEFDGLKLSIRTGVFGGRKLTIEVASVRATRAGLAAIEEFFEGSMA